MSYDLDAGVVGCGGFGTALSHILAERDRRIELWVRGEEKEVADEINREHRNSRYAEGFALSPKVRATVELEEVVRRARVVILAVPSEVFRRVARDAGAFIHADQVVVHGTKGFEIATFKRMSEILHEETCARKIGVLSGPTLSREILAGHPAGAVIASRYHEVVEAAQQLFSGGRFRVYGGRDVIGTEVGGAFKNIIALAAGFVDAMRFGDNTKALLVARGLSEMTLLGASLGADIATFSGLAGVGDLMATCASPLSRNHQVGQRLAHGESVAEVLGSLRHVAEGVPTTKAVHQHAVKVGLELPIVAAVHSVLYEGKSAHEALDELSARPFHDEIVEVPARQALGR